MGSTGAWARPPGLLLIRTRSMFNNSNTCVPTTSIFVGARTEYAYVYAKCTSSTYDGIFQPIPLNQARLSPKASSVSAQKSASSSSKLTGPASSVATPPSGSTALAIRRFSACRVQNSQWHSRFRSRGTEYLRESGMKWMCGRAKRRRDRSHLQLGHPRLHAVGNEQPVDHDLARLPVAPGPRHRLLLEGRVPPEVAEEDMVSHRQVQPDARHVERQQQHVRRPRHLAMWVGSGASLEHR